MTHITSFFKRVSPSEAQQQREVAARKQRAEFLRDAAAAAELKKQKQQDKSKQFIRMTGDMLTGLPYAFGVRHMPLRQ
jgi:hypothetical protein